MQENTAPTNRPASECTCPLGQDHTCGLSGRHLISLQNVPSAMEERFRSEPGLTRFSRRW